MVEPSILVMQAKRAWKQFQQLDQQKTDAIVRAAYLAALQARTSLAKLACEETTIGIWEDKALKNALAAQVVYDYLRDLRTVGVIEEDSARGLTRLARSRGPILALMPITNPTSTTIFKILICLKTQNPIIISPHNAAKRCIAEAARVCYEAALAAGAPEDCIQWLEKSSPKNTQELMSDPGVALILATGTSSLVKTAQSSGRPVIGVGPGNVPVCICASADIPRSVSSIVDSKTFDHGTVCASEQAVIVTEDVAQAVRSEFKRRGAYFLSPQEQAAIAKIAVDPLSGGMAAGVVGQPAMQIAKSAAIEVGPNTKLLIAELTRVGREAPLSAEILAPILAFYTVETLEQAISRCNEILEFGGRGHTAVIHSSREDEVSRFSRCVDAGRILINTPATLGALGGTYNSLPPSLSLASGSGGNNIYCDNIGVEHLLQVYQVAEPRENLAWKRLAAGSYQGSDPADKLDQEYFDRR